MQNINGGKKGFKKFRNVPCHTPNREKRIVLRGPSKPNVKLDNFVYTFLRAH